MTEEQSFKNRDIISITDLSPAEILFLCEKAAHMARLEDMGRRYELKGSVCNRRLASFFYEASTRTRLSTNTAAYELGMASDGFSGIEGTSVMKKESIRDTIMMAGANHFDVVIMRNGKDGSLQWAADVSDIPVINGGDGKNEHPTQALLDLSTLYMFNHGRFDRIRIGLGGDLSHGRTIRSLSLALSHFSDITLRWATEDFLGMPQELSDLLASRGVKVERFETVRDVLANVDFYYMTRPQLERMPGITPQQIQEMLRHYRLDLSKVKGFDVKILHPLPVSSEVAEIDYGVYFSPVQGFFKQAEFGVFLRKALLYEMLKHEGYTRFSGSLDSSLEQGNNRLTRLPGKTKNGMFIDKLTYGAVLDHLVGGSAQPVAAALKLTDHGYDCVPADMPSKRKSLLKTNLGELTERQLKLVALMSPQPTVSIIRDNEISAKFVYLLCQNDNCVTGVINEDVPPKFYYDGSKIRCRYCRRPLDITNPKVTPAEIGQYCSSLPRTIEPTRK